MMRHFYAFRHAYGLNARSGHDYLPIGCILVFERRADRDRYVGETAHCMAEVAGYREALGAAEVRRFFGRPDPITALCHGRQLVTVRHYDHGRDRLIVETPGSGGPYVADELAVYHA